MLEHSVSDYDALHPDPKGWFLQISGIYKFFSISLKFVLDLGLTHRCRNKDEYFHWRTEYENPEMCFKNEDEDSFTLCFGDKSLGFPVLGFAVLLVTARENLI
jgi:hypothetical protein